MRNNKIRLSESQIRNIVKESVYNILREFEDSDYENGNQRQIAHKMRRGNSGKGLDSHTANCKLSMGTNKETMKDKSRDLNGRINKKGQDNLQSCNWGNKKYRGTMNNGDMGTKC